MKRLKSIISSDSDSDEIDISKIKKKYSEPPKKVSKNETISKKTKDTKTDHNQMDILAAFKNSNSSKKKVELTMDNFLIKKPKIDKIEISPVDFFNTSKISLNKSSKEIIQTPSVKKSSLSIVNNDNLENVSLSSPPSNKTFISRSVETPSSPKITTNSLETNTSPLKPSLKDNSMEVVASPNNKISFAKFMHRGGPQALGSKEVPEGSPNCLMGLTFVITGVLDSIERDDAQSLIERHGGRVTKAVSGKTTYLLVGLEPGESKVEKANKLKVKQMNEDELFDLIRTLSAKLTKTSTPLASTKNATGKPLVTSTNATHIDVIVDNKKSLPPTKPEPKLTAQPIIAKPELIYPAAPRETSSTLFVTKHAPTTLKKIVGQHGDRSPANKLLIWLRNFEKNLLTEPKVDDDGGQFRAALLSGPPGIGKTTTAQLVCKELGYHAVELNASDIRSKNSIKDVISDSLRTKSFYQNKNLKHCLIMDEVDGMAGNEDRGGINELIQIIKTTRHPIICICNDRQSRKLQSFVKHVYDLRFRQLTVDQMKATILTVAFKEGLKIPEEALMDIVKSSNFDIRQVLNNVQFWSAGAMDQATLKTDARDACKEFKLGPFDVITKVFSHENVKTFSDKSDLFFQDYQLGGLFVQENYPLVRPYLAKGNMKATMRLMSLAADSIAMGDVCSKKISATNNWTLLPLQAMFASVIPGQYLHGRLAARAEFPGWLGKYSKTNKNVRVMASLCAHMRQSSQAAFAMDCAPLLARKLAAPLREGDVETTLDGLHQLQVTKEDMDLLLEATAWSHLAPVLAGVPAQTKAALTRAYNKAGVRLPYASVSVRGRAVIGAMDDGVGDDDGEEGAVEEEAEEESVEMDAMIVKRKATTARTAHTAAEAKTKKTAPKRSNEPKPAKEKKPAAKRPKK